MSGAVTTALSQDGPLMWMGQAIEARLALAFPPAYFDFAWMPAKADRAWFKRYLRRTPAIALGWNGCQATSDDGGVFTAHAHWTVALITKNAAGPEARLMGDALAPGLFAMQRVATLMLHGWLIDPDGTPWTATGSTIVTAAGNLYNDEWGDEDTAICGLDLSVLYEETLPAGLIPSPSIGNLIDCITWDFGEQPPLLTQTIDTTGAS
jgi:hypothetical protein